MPKRPREHEASGATRGGLARYWGDNSPPAYALTSANAVYVNLLYEQLSPGPPMRAACQAG